MGFRFRLPLTNAQLGKVGIVVGLYLGGNMVYMYYLQNKRFHQSPYFTKAADIVFQKPAVIEYFGEPIKFGNPDLNNKSNFSTHLQAHYEIPLKGSKKNGTMVFTSKRDAPPSEDPKNIDVSIPWRVESLEVFVDDRPNEKIVLVR